MDCVNNTKGEPVKELQDLRQEYNSFRTLYNIESIMHEQIENKLSEFTDALDSSVNAVIIADLEGMIRYANPAFLNMFEYTNLDQVISQYASKLFPSKKVKRFSDVSAIINNSKGETEEFLARSRDGEEFNVEVSSSIITNRLGKTTGRMASFVNITERKNGENSIKAQNQELEKRAAELVIANKELAYQNELKEKGAAELIIINKELAFQNEEKEKRAAELVIANKELVFQNGEKERRATELDIANKELAFQNDEKEKRAAELVVANKELVFQNGEKEKRATELIIANKELALQNDEKEKRAGELVIANKELAHQNELKEKSAIELMNAKEKAEESDRLKTAFLSNMSHEIRTPMNGILGFTELLNKPDLSDEEQKEFISIIEESGKRMLDTINDIIDMSKIESGLIGLNNLETNINQQVELVYIFFKPEAESKGLNFSFKNSLPAEKVNIKTDKEKVQKILINLVKNAIKFSDEGSIEFGYEIKGKHLEFFVKDTGVGIPYDRQGVIFERFIQADVSDSRAFQGSGLGLTITKSYVELLGGKIWVESEEGKGSVFYFTIPCLIEQGKNKLQVTTSINDEISLIKDLKLLIVEDDEISKKYLTEIVCKNCKEIIYAKSGNEAVDICKNNQDIDLVLMDIKIPNTNGYEATRQIRQFNKDIFIIAQTALAQIGDREKAINAGCNDYISKPFEQTQLINLINKGFLKAKSF